jgi:hypothetical protein
VAISGKTRKLLWANSGNRCALCGSVLSHPQAKNDPAAIVGDECHIISGAQDGPRFDPFFHGDNDGYENLLLLCASDHRLVDTQLGTYSVEKLKQLKANHEAVVARAVASAIAPPNIKGQTEGFDNFRTEIVFAAGQQEADLERFQKVIIRDSRLRSYGRVGTGFHGPSAQREYSWIQAFLPVSAALVRALADEARIRITDVRQVRLAGTYHGLIPDR